MKFTTQQVKEARAAHDLYWESYLAGDINTLTSLLDEHYTQIGSVEQEVFFNKKDAVQCIVDTIDQIGGKLQMQNRITKPEVTDTFILFHELCDLYVLSEGEWVFYSKFRASSLMQEQATGWKMVHQHFSLPDYRAKEGDNIALEKVSEENLRLQEAIKARTIELEQKNRELEIEAALEKVRSTSLAMRNSGELEKVVAVLFDKLAEIGLSFDGTLIFIFDKSRRNIDLWIATSQLNSPELISLPYDEDIRDNQLWKDLWRAKEEGIDIFNQAYTGAVKNDYFRYVAKYNKAKIPEQIMELQQSAPGWMGTFAAEENSVVGFDSWSGRLTSEEDFKILKRFSREFEQSYTRFLDLQKAEVQAREAEVELALERVRARTMAMQHSEELGEVSFLLDKQVRSLGIKTWGCAFNIFQEKDSLEWFSTENGVMPTFTLPRESFFLDFYETCKSGEPFFIKEWIGEECTAHYEYLASIPSVGVGLRELKAKGISYPTYQLDHVAAFKYGYLLFITYEAVPEAHDIFKRFAKVFEQTYTRFLDLQKAESQAKEAQIELSLERIRAQVTAMQASTDLLDIVVLMRHEFISLGHEAYYFWHMRWLPDGYQKAMTSAYGNKIGMVMDLPLGFHGDQRTVDWEKSGEPIGIFPYPGEAAVAYIEGMIRAGKFDQIDPDAPTPERLRADGGLTVIMARTTHGEIGYSLPGVVSEPPQGDLNALMRFAGVFDLAYTRFEDLLTAEANTRRAEEDLIQLKKAKAQAENALIELKAAQDQLIQQEKLASLGQLTAGIAHEIKNPLNFVNNFSELSQELIEEAFSELEKTERNIHREEIEGLLRDIRSNLSKVHEHGTRANGIVTSMLMHSRASAGKLELKDFNPIVKEFVNLSFHGMRAGKSPINVAIDLRLDPQVGKVPLISEDFSRVILNLCNNAFDAMREKLKKAQETRISLQYAGLSADQSPVDQDIYEPKLIVKTSLHSNRVILSVADNGSGIPKEIEDKILQPFFTTKKGTEGTGLGLSISNDIVKAHGGELRVETTEGKGAVFTIHLPAN